MKLSTILENENPDVVSVTIPLLIKLMEWAHEDAADDIAIHELVEKLTANGGTLDTAMFDQLVGDTTDQQDVKIAGNTIERM